MSSLQLNGDTSGSVTLAVPAVAGTNTATLPAATGTVMVSGNMPAFSAYASNNQSISSGVFTKVALNTKDFDTASCFDATTNYRFTPTVAGYYQINGVLRFSLTAGATDSIIALYKNGSVYKRGQEINLTVSGINQIVGSWIVYLNGSTDYIELYGYVTGSSTSFQGGASDASSMLNGTLMRAA